MHLRHRRRNHLRTLLGRRRPRLALIIALDRLTSLLRLIHSRGRPVALWSRHNVLLCLICRRSRLALIISLHRPALLHSASARGGHGCLRLTGRHCGSLLIRLRGRYRTRVYLVH